LGEKKKKKKKKKKKTPVLVAQLIRSTSLIMHSAR